MAATNYSFGQLKTRVINLEVQHNTLTSICMVMARRLRELERKVGGVPETKQVPVKEEVKKVSLKKEKKKKKRVVYVEESDSETEEEIVRVPKSRSRKKKEKKPEPVKEPLASETETSDSEVEVEEVQEKVVEKPAPKKRGRKPKNQTINILESVDS